MNAMKIIPVIDLLHSQVVRGVAGQRDTYRPVQSTLLEGADAVQVAHAFRQSLGLNEFYVADLDAILHRRPNLEILRTLANDDFRLWIDAGVRTCTDATELSAILNCSVVAGLETLAGPHELERLCTQFGPDRVVFSLDLQAGRPMGDLSLWDRRSPLELATTAADCGVRRMIVLDLAQVGVSAGISTLDLCREIRNRLPNVELTTGGGVRNAADLQSAQAAGLDAVLVASALHTGTINRASIDQLTRSDDFPHAEPAEESNS